MRRPSLCGGTAAMAVALGAMMAIAASAQLPASALSPSPAPVSIAAQSPTPTTVASPGPAVDSVGLRLVEAPQAAADDPRAQIYIVDHLTPGTSIERRIEVSATTTEAVHVELYAAAAQIKGTAFVGDAGHKANDLSSWTSIDPAFVDVAPGGISAATVHIDVPSDAAPGEQYAVVWAEVRAAPSAAGGLVQVSRVGIRLYVSVGPGGAPAADFRIDSLSAGRSATGAPTVTATVENTGGRALDMSGSLNVSDGPGGLRAGPFDATIGNTLAIGATEPVTVVLDEQLPGGPWSADMELHSGLVERSGHATITFPDAGTAAAVPTAGSTAGASRLVPVGLAVALMGGGAAATTISFRRRQLGRRRTAPQLTRWHWIED